MWISNNVRFPVQAEQKRRGRVGFTLPEVIVTLTLIAALAAVVVPSIVSQVKKGDPSAVGNDLLAIRGATEQFLGDVRKYPGSIYQLTNVITNTQNPLFGTSAATFGTADVNRWRGPYISKDSAAARITAYGSFAVNFDTNSYNGQKYLVVLLPMADSLAGLEVDKQFDDGVLATGSIRYVKKTGSGTDTLKYLMMPIY
jgi:prepilin-type N-terminal cleavage/methylation domain-containing protein